ncbi:zinc-ribbon domain-containing protein [Oceanobacillus manasiensis]|uniref:zinc-ribbon domain-containing protein n=1 Tax=Oceanobacillus manasiensis TaxID=586413 RepID=UPI0005A98F9C|nr:zinc ribbon domain-containing protein [Oceanobacillus manasiensis]
MFCSNCGNPLKENEKFCSNCGKEMSISEGTEKPSLMQRIKNNKKSFMIGIGALLIVAIVFVKFTGGGSPEDKVESFIESIANEDVDLFAEIMMETWAWNMNEELTYEFGDNWSKDLSIQTIEELEDTASIAVDLKYDSDEMMLFKNDDNGKWMLDIASDIVIEGKNPRVVAEDIYEAIASVDSKNISKMVDLETRADFQYELVELNSEFKEKMGRTWVDNVRVETVMETDTTAVVEVLLGEDSGEVELVKTGKGNWVLSEDFYY